MESSSNFRNVAYHLSLYFFFLIYFIKNNLNFRLYRQISNFFLLFSIMGIILYSFKFPFSYSNCYFFLWIRLDSKKNFYYQINFILNFSLQKMNFHHFLVEFFYCCHYLNNSKILIFNAKILKNFNSKITLYIPLIKKSLY